MLTITPNYTPDPALANNCIVTVFEVCVNVNVPAVNVVQVILLDITRTDGKVIINLAFTGKAGVCFNLNV